MMRRIFWAVILAVVMSSCAFGATWTERVSEAWKGTKNFFMEDIPSYCVSGVDWLKDWWNNSGSKKLDSKLDLLAAELSSLRRDIASLVKTTPSRVVVSGFNDSSRDAELLRREQELADLKRSIDAQREALYQQAHELAKLSQDIAAREQALQEESSRMDDFTRKYHDAEEKAAKIHDRLSNEGHIMKFIAAGMFAKIDTERFMLYDKSYGAVNIPGTPYGTLTANLDTDKFGFIDTSTLKASLKSLFRDDTLSLRGDSSVVLVREDDRASWNKQIDSVSDKAFFTIEGLALELEGLSHVPDNTESEIAAFLKVNDQRGRLRIFFRTRHEGLYVLVLMDNENSQPVIYLAADMTQKLINRRDLPRALRSSTELRNSGKEAALFFDPEDSKIDIYLDRFVKGLVEKIPGCKD